MDDMKHCDELAQKVMGIFFRSNYYGFGENTPQDIEFLQTTPIYVFITGESMMNGYEYDRKNIINNGLLLMHPYRLKSMNVGISSSTLELLEYPGVNFNSVNFNFKKL